MRMKLIVGLLGLALLTAAFFPLTRSDAARSRAKASQAFQNPQAGGPTGRALPNYDIRLADRDEFADYDLTSPQGRERAMQRAAVRARIPAT